MYVKKISRQWIPWYLITHMYVYSSIKYVCIYAVQRLRQLPLQGMDSVPSWGTENPTCHVWPEKGIHKHEHT